MTDMTQLELISLSYALYAQDLVSGNQCECPLACEVVKYETKTSAAAFPSPLLIKHWKMQGVNKTDDYLRYVDCKLLKRTRK